VKVELNSEQIPPQFVGAKAEIPHIRDCGEFQFFPALNPFFALTTNEGNFDA
jgi:hypothetical protein